MQVYAKVHHTGHTDEGDLAKAVAHRLAERGYVMCYNGYSSTVYDTTSEPPLRVTGNELATEVQAHALAVLADTAADRRVPTADRDDADATTVLLSTAAPGSTSYLRRVTAHVREALPEVEREAVCPVVPRRERREYMADYARKYRADVRAAAEAEALELLPDMLPSGKFELGEVWDAWRAELEADPAYADTHPYAATIGKTQFYRVLDRLENARIAKGSGRKRYLYVD